MMSVQHSIHQKIRPRNQSPREVRDWYDLSQPLQYVLHQPLVLIHKIERYHMSKRLASRSPAPKQVGNTREVPRYC